MDHPRERIAYAVAATGRCFISLSKGSGGIRERLDVSWSMVDKEWEFTEGKKGVGEEKREN